MGTIKAFITWDNNYGVYSDDALGSVATGKTLDEAKENFRSALEFHLEGMHEDGDDIPENIQGNIDIVFELNTKAILHHYEGVITRSGLAKRTRINERLLGHYATGYRTPRRTQRKKIIDGIHSLGKELLELV